jgi:hypothetical protein
MCVAATLANALGIPACAAASADREAESTKCVGRSEAGLAAHSPGRRHCSNIYSFITNVVKLRK